MGVEPIVWDTARIKTIDIIYKINMEDPERGVEESRPVKDHGTQETNFL